MATWVVSNNKIKLKLSQGEIKAVDSVDIIRAEYKGAITYNDLIISTPPSKQISDLTFHRFPLNLRLCVTPPGLKKSAYCWLEAYDPDWKIIINEFDDDQLIHESNWFSLIIEDSKAIKDAMSIASITTLGVINLKQYLDLIRQDVSQVLINGVELSFRNEVSQKKEQALNYEGFSGKLYKYQEVGVQWLKAVISEGLGSILGDEMGLGKTIQIIAVLVSEINAGRKPSLIIAPATLLENWRREIKKFAPTLITTIHRGQDRTGFPSNIKKSDIIITSYDTVVRDISLINMINWNLTILDEAQAIKNPDTLRSSTIKTIPRFAGLAVTGTPIENCLRDLWSIMDFCCPGLLGDQVQFEARYTDSIEDAAKLEHIVSPLLLRRLVSEVATDLPERIDISQAIELTAVAAMKYDTLRNEIKNEYGKSANLVALTKLRMFCTHPFLITKDRGDPALHSSKYLRLLEILDEVMAAKHKVIIFTSYVEMIDIFMSDLSIRFKCYCSFIDGRVAVEHRQNIVDGFIKAQGAALLILNPKAAGTGLNITAANYVIHYNLDWNPAVEDQATARAYRRGLTHPVTVYRLFHPGTVEEIIDQRVAIKRDLAEKAIVGSKGELNEREFILQALEISPAV